MRAACIPLLALCGIVAGCGSPPSLPPARAETPPAARALFTEEAEARGLRFTSSYTGSRPLNIEQTAGTGLAIWDYDGDGRLDLFVVGHEAFTPGGAGRLFHNGGGAEFEDRTARSGLEIPGKWHGCAVGDIDNDGRPDLLLTGYGVLKLFRNEGAGKFEDVSEAWGLKASPAAWTTSAAFADVDRDGWLDLYVGRYVQFDKTQLQLCDYHGVRAACGPKVYDRQTGSLYRNLKGRRFEDVTRGWGLSGTHGKTFGVAFADANGDGYPDLYLANDEVPGDLYINLDGKGFREIGASSSTAYSADGQVQGGMGVDWSDYDRDGRLDLFVTTFQGEDHSLYRNLGSDLFENTSGPMGLGEITRPYVAFGTRFLDFDNDGWPDIWTVSGHIQDNVSAIDSTTTYRQKMQLFRNEEGAAFRDVSALAGPAFSQEVVGRGVATGDLDGDGDLDVAVTDLEGPVRLFMNQAQGNHWLGVRLQGTRSNRMGLGSEITVSRSGDRWVAQAQSGGSFLSASDAVAHFGLGKDPTPVVVEVRWPSGKRTRRAGVRADQVVVMSEDA